MKGNILETHKEVTKCKLAVATRTTLLDRNSTSQWNVCQSKLIPHCINTYFFFFHGVTARGGPKPPSFWDFIPKVFKSVSVHSVVSDRLTDLTSFCSILMRLPEPSGRQSGDLGEKWPLWILLTDITVGLIVWLLVLFMPIRFFYMP
jgi:hypothetical protein